MTMRPPLVQVEEIDPRHEAAFDAWFAVLQATDAERWPDKPGWQRVERLAMALDDDGPEEHRLLVARDDAGAVRGIADLELYRRENLQLARVDLRVLPAWRRRGIGSSLLAAVEQLVVAAGRTELGGMDETPVGPDHAGGPDYEDAAGPFAVCHGFTFAQEMVRRELRLPLSRRHARALADSPKSRPSGYSLITFADRWPDELIEDRCELGRRMSTDVPMGEQELDEEVWDEARVRQIEAAFAAQNRAKVITVARDDDSGRLAGFTEIAVPLGAPESVWQHDTLVVREHRGHGLGFAMKVANLAALELQFAAARSLSTWNAAENAPMIAVNDEMGFEVVARSNYWLKKLESMPAGSRIEEAQDSQHPAVIRLGDR
jgi:GNAT superfamily N-acetyltransferase